MAVEKAKGAAPKRKRKTSEKRARQSVERAGRNRYYVSSMKTAVKKAKQAIFQKDFSRAPSLIQEAIRKIQKAGSKKAIHRNEVRRRVSRLMKLANKTLRSTT